MADWDFSIENMDFRLAINDSTPYERATAPFKKDQVDNSATPGDNSLTGWWVRSQLSFHKGQGITYYEVAQGDETLNRYQWSRGLNIFTPGEVFTLYPTATATASTFTRINDVAPIGDSDYAAVDDNGVLKELDMSAGTLTTKVLNGGLLTRITASDDAYFAATTANKIERFSHDGTKNAVLYNYTGALSGVWYAKGRLWVIAKDGSVFTVAANPTGTLPITLSNPVAVVADLTDASGNDMTTLAESPGAVYIARGGGAVFRVGLSSDGSVPTLADAVVACTLPFGEVVECLQYYLGYMVMVTSKGVRVAVVDEATGGLTYGPVFIENQFDPHCRRIGVYGNFVLVGLGYLYAIDLSEPTADNPLIYPYSEWDEPPFGGSFTFTGTVCTSSPRPFMWFMGSHFLSVSDPNAHSPDVASPAMLRTGYHRFGTLDNKSFHSVVVRVKGDDGTIDVYQEDAEGIETLLGAIDASVEKVKEFPFVTNGPVERMALFFEFKAGANWAPTLLGYQLKALPVPKRQRILKVPLLIQDVIRLRGGAAKGKRGKAWTDLQALEALESSQAIVSFTDHRTGETGQAYIDMVDFQCDTPAVRDNNGFGGTAYIQLRVIGS